MNSSTHDWTRSLSAVVEVDTAGGVAGDDPFDPFDEHWWHTRAAAYQRPPIRSQAAACST